MLKEWIYFIVLHKIIIKTKRIMRKFKTFFTALLIMSVFVSCGSDTPDVPDNNGGGVENPNPDPEPEEEKE